MDKSGIFGPMFNILGLWFLKFRKIAIFPSPRPEILMHHACNLLFRVLQGASDVQGQCLENTEMTVTSGSLWLRIIMTLLMNV